MKTLPLKSRERRVLPTPLKHASMPHKHPSRPLQLTAFGVLSSLLLSSLLPLAAAAQGDAAPNVILIMTDDQGYGDIGFHGNSMIHTPKLDELARTSFRLSNFHVDPTCSETRSALMTGRYSCRTGVWHTIMGRSILRRDEVTMADIFRANGYRTGMFGKWHLGDNEPYRPHDRGFDEVLYHGGGGVGQAPDFWGNDYFDDTYFRKDGPQEQTGYCTDVFFDAAMQFIDQTGDAPFFCYIPTNAAHGPFLVDESYARRYIEAGVPQPMANFYGMITNIDENVRRLDSFLEEKKIADNTILIFMTDNGTAAGVARNRDDRSADAWLGYNAEMRGQKGSQYEGGHRVPCFIRWPEGNVRAAASDSLAAHFDLVPTLIELCELTSPQGVEFDGVSLADLLRGAEDAESAIHNRTLVVHSQRIDHPEHGRKCSVMTNRWRLVDLNELYDLHADPIQQQNVASDHAEVVEQLRESYDQWWDSVSTRFDEYCELDLGIRANEATQLCSHDWHSTGGGVPWNQSMIGRDLQANGYWVVQVAQEGTYQFELRLRPKGFEHPISTEDGIARISIFDREWRQAFEAGSTSVTFNAQLPAGTTRLQTWLTRDEGKTQGAYFVEVTRLEEQQQIKLELRKNDRVALVGGAYIERMQNYGYFETTMLSRLPEHSLRFRNLGWSGDDVFGTARAVFGSIEDGYQRRLVDLRKAEPTVVLLAYGDNDAFAGEQGLERFLAGYQRLLDDIAQLDVRLGLIAPPKLHEIGGFLPDPSAENEKRLQYRDAVEALAAERGIPFFDMFEPIATDPNSESTLPIIRDRISNDGVHLNQYGYWRTASILAELLGATAPDWQVSLDPLGVSLDVDGAEPVDFEVAPSSTGAISIRFQLTDDYHPLSPLPDSRPRGARMIAPHDLIKIRGLSPGKYGLNIDGQPTLLATAQQWHDGVRIMRGNYLAELQSLRELVNQKNRDFFHYHRPQNETYLFLFRKHEQGNNAVEVDQFPPLIAEAEQEINQLLHTRTHVYEIVAIPE